MIVGSVIFLISAIVSSSENFFNDHLLSNHSCFRNSHSSLKIFGSGIINSWRLISVNVPVSQKLVSFDCRLSNISLFCNSQLVTKNFFQWLSTQKTSYFCKSRFIIKIFLSNDCRLSNISYFCKNQQVTKIFRLILVP